MYAKANYNAETDSLSLADNKYCVIIIRQANVYVLSPRMRFDLSINGMTKGFYQKGKIPILKDGTQWRPFVHVRDTSKAMTMLLEADPSKVNKQLINVGSNEQNYQVFNLAERVAKAIGIPFEYEWYGDPDHRSYQVNFDKIRDLIGFKPDYDAEKGAREVWNALKEKRLNPDDPQTITIKWYQKLASEGITI